MSGSKLIILQIISAYIIAWADDTDSLDRIRSVLTLEREYRSVSELADRAVVSEQAATAALERLERYGVAEAKESDSDNEVLYRRDTAWPVSNMLRRILAIETIDERLETLEPEVEKYQEVFGVAHPEAVAEEVRELSDDEHEALSHWRTAERTKAYVEAVPTLQDVMESEASV